MKDEDKTKGQLISELSELRQQLQSDEQRNRTEGLKNILATTMDNLTEGVVISDNDSRIIYVNKALERLIGYSRHELIGKDAGILNGEKDAKSIQQEIISCMQRSERWCRETIQRRKDGSTYLAELEVFPVFQDDGTPVARAAIQRDITRRRQVENALRESEAKYRALMEQIPAITYVAALDEASTTLYISPQVEKLLGFSPADYKADPDIWRRQLVPEDRERVLADVARCHASKEKFVSEYRMIIREGRVLWFHDEAVVIHDETGNPVCLQGAMFDITDRKRAEEALRVSEERFSKAFNASPSPMAISTLNEGRLIEVNESHTRVIGYSR